MCGDFEILRFFSLCVGAMCVGTLRIYVFFPVCGDFEILRFFPCVCGDFEILRFFPSVCVCGEVWVCGDFQILSAFFLCVRPLCVETLRFYGFSLCVGPCAGDFENFQKNPYREKSQVWGL